MVSCLQQGVEFFGETSERYVGEYAKDLREGQGNAYNQDGSLKYLGAWRQGRPHGIGTAYYKLYDSMRKNFMARKLSGTFVGGIYIGPPDEPTTSEYSHYASKQDSKGNFLLQYGKTLSISFYHMMTSLITNVLQTLFH